MDSRKLKTEASTCVTERVVVVDDDDDELVVVVAKASTSIPEARRRASTERIHWWKVASLPVKGVIPVVVIAAAGVVIFEAHNLLEYDRGKRNNCQ